ncbi:trimeric intracellular cation channel type 1B.1-like, partial [Artemia franciscana]|uniref:trimeric intracellular cation channel type 1B.1-like n=1 Tax=Artemia franciscana TaxID=6661 RepID=UPI0032DB953E
KINTHLAGSHGFSRKYPLACWVSTMLVIYAGGFIAALLLGEPMLSPLKNTQSVHLATAVWYVIFYSPFDIGYKFAKFLPVKILIAALKEVYRTKKVYDGVSHAAKLFPNSWLIMIVIGVVKGNGGGFIKIAERLIRGVWTPSAIELLQPTFPTKACIAVAIVFVIDKKTDYLT